MAIGGLAWSVYCWQQNRQAHIDVITPAEGKGVQATVISWPGLIATDLSPFSAVAPGAELFVYDANNREPDIIANELAKLGVHLLIFPEYPQQDLLWSKRLLEALAKASIVTFVPWSNYWQQLGVKQLAHLGAVLVSHCTSLDHCSKEHIADIYVPSDNAMKAALATAAVTAMLIENQPHLPSPALRSQLKKRIPKRILDPRALGFDITKP